MRPLVSAIFYLWTSSLAFAGEYCGSKSGFFQELASEELIPDYFPPESPLLARIFSDSHKQRCESIATVPLYIACSAHDSCYQKRAPKSSCDRALRDAWVKSCRQVYVQLTLDAQWCRISCEIFSKIMSKAQRYDHAGFCPSCDAYDNF